MNMTKTKGLVYSTDSGRICPHCENPIEHCRCKENALPAGDGVVRVSRQTKGRKGGGVSLITGLPLNENDLKKLSKQFKKLCGSGGTIKNGVVEIQGDHREVLVKALLKLGYKAKLAGG